MKIAVIAGTSDAVSLIHQLPDYDITAFTATEYGKEILKNSSCRICVGRLDKQAFLNVLSDFDAVADASHPFAQQVSANVKETCRFLSLPYFRLIRPEMQYDYKKIYLVSGKEEAARILSDLSGNILLTTGVMTLHFYEQHVKNFDSRGFVRILDTEDSRRMAEKAVSHVIFAIPPFSEQDTLDLIQKYQIAVLVTKDSGQRGGLPEKINAARIAGIPVLMLKRPDETGMSIPEIISNLKKLEENIC